jgi:hypothetical protein
MNALRNTTALAHLKARVISTVLDQLSATVFGHTE